MIGRIKIGKTNFTFVLRHRFENHDDTVESFRHKMEWRRWEISLWYRPSKIVGSKNFNNPNEWGNNLVRSHMIGIELLLFKAWVEFHRGGMIIPLD